MTDVSRIRFNPATKEIEVEGSEEFVKVYFNKILELFFGGPDETGAPRKAPRPVKRNKQAGKQKPAEGKTTNVEAIVALIQGRPEGISTAELKEKTGVAESQIWNIVNRAAKEGRIRKLKRGLYAAGIAEMPAGAINGDKAAGFNAASAQLFRFGLSLFLLMAAPLGAAGPDTAIALTTDGPDRRLPAPAGEPFHLDPINPFGAGTRFLLL